MKKPAGVILIGIMLVVMLFMKWWYQDRIEEYVIKYAMQNYLFEHYQEDFT